MRPAIKPALILVSTSIVVATVVAACYSFPGLSGSQNNNQSSGSGMIGGSGSSRSGVTTYPAAYGVADLTEQNFESFVIRSSQPVLVDFYATWCGPCKRMSPIVDDFAQKHRTMIKVYRCDIDLNRALANRYGIDAVPTFMVFRKGSLVGRFMGADSAESFESNILQSLRSPST